LAVLRQQGLHAWIACAAAASTSATPAESTTPAASRPVATVTPEVAAMSDHSPLICLCTDMLLPQLISTNHQENP
jgi:hypothetical protein